MAERAEAMFLKEAEEKFSRLLAHGVDYSDLTSVVSRVKDEEAWLTEWSKMADVHRKLAEDALARGGSITAGEAFERASIYYHFAQFIYFKDWNKKLAAMDKRSESFKRGAPLLVPPAARVVFRFENVDLPGYLRVPSRGGRYPCVIHIGGVDSTKEENHFLTEDYLKRGMATLCIDGPGQGEVWRAMKMREDFEKVVSAILDNLNRLEEVDPDRLGIVGRSMGGHYACRVAANDGRIKAVITNGGSYDMSSWPKRPLLAKESFMFFTGAKNLEEAYEISKTVTLQGLLDKIRCPLMIIQGGKDALVPAANAERITKEVKGDKSVIIYEDSDHGLHNVSYIMRPAMADWMKEKLGATDLQGE